MPQKYRSLIPNLRTTGRMELLYLPPVVTQANGLFSYIFEYDTWLRSDAYRSGASGLLQALDKQRIKLSR